MEIARIGKYLEPATAALATSHAAKVINAITVSAYFTYSCKARGLLQLISFASIVESMLYIYYLHFIFILSILSFLQPFFTHSMILTDH